MDEVNEKLKSGFLKCGNKEVLYYNLFAYNLFLILPF
jgi:hypothetical protein